MNKQMTAVYNDLLAQAMMFDMQVDWETLELVPKTELPQHPSYLQRWIDRNADKQMDHEFMMRDGDD